MNARRVLILIVVLGFVLVPLAPAQAGSAPGEKIAAAEAQKPAPAEAAPAKPAAKKPPVKRTEPVVPAYLNIKEKSHVKVFYVFLWLSIGVLLYFLRWWVQEADRVYKARFYKPAESPRKDNPLPPLLGE